MVRMVKMKLEKELEKKKKKAPTRVWTENLEEGVLERRTRDYAFWFRESIELLPQDQRKTTKCKVLTNGLL